MAITKSRLIYTAGTFAITPGLAVSRRLIITASVLRKPSIQLYQNEKSNPPKGFLGYCSLFINAYCYSVFPLEFSPQAILLWDNPAMQIYYSAGCIAIQAANNLVTLGSAMSPPAALFPFPITQSDFPGCPYTAIKFKLWQGTRLQIDAVGEEVVACDGLIPAASLPDTFSPAAPYPIDRARSDDPARSAPEPGENPGDTAPATVEDPDASLTNGPCSLTIFNTRSDLPGQTFSATFTVPNATYSSAYLDVVGPGSTYYARSAGSQGVITLAGPFNPGSIVVNYTGFSLSCPS